MTQSPPARSVQVLVVGAGPVGLVAALAAARRGLDTLVLDQNWRGYAPGHATLLHASSLRLLAEFGIEERLTAAGRTLDSLTLHVDAGDAVAVPLEAPVLAVPQQVLEETLLAALRAEGVELMAPVRAVSIDQGDERVHVHAIRRELTTLGSPAHYSEWEQVASLTIHADHVVGADGYESRVRAALGIQMVELSPAQSFAMFEFQGKAPAASAIDLIFSGELVSVAVPLPEGRTRLGFQLDAALSDAPDVERLSRLLSERAPWIARPPAVDWGVVTHFERRVARQFGRKRVWLAGDAAHITSPFGAQSMNVGLAEAYGLIRRIADQLEGRKTEEALAQYDAQGQREWHKLLGINAHFDLLPHAPAWLSACARRLVPCLPASGRDLERLLARLGLVIR